MFVLYLPFLFLLNRFIFGVLFFFPNLNETRRQARDNITSIATSSPFKSKQICYCFLHKDYSIWLIWPEKCHTITL